ncbi:hypothetical protein HGI47_19005 [Novosphingobium sp. ERN07]|uniref:hypothetical protein n=1 Tax=Novosphingobium sp. ERN07 TaxID=2726187 RepID=UPI0014564F6C|nr:hypothetical protein [Novosphingobium sp. ERN07]NLR72966.1 hypothetical protein [Novosphingobium sp. ERN07]
MAFVSFRSRLRAFQTMRCDPPEPGFIADLEFLENRDLDLSVRLGAMLGLNALLITIGTHPISASPGAPLSLDAPTQAGFVLANLAALLPLVISCFLALRAMLLGEEFDADGLEGDAALRQRLFASFIRSIDAQARLLYHAVRWTITGGALNLLLWGAILYAKMA